MQHLQKVLIFLTSVLFVIFAVQFGLAQYEYLTWPEPMLGFAVDAAPQYPVALYHAISLLLLVSIIVADKYITAFLIVISYGIIHSFGTFWRLRSGFFGGDMCPDGGLCYMALRRATWFDWTSTFILISLLCLIVVAVIVGGRRKIVVT